MTNRRNGTLYTGVTDDSARRAWEHRAGVVASFTGKYGLKMLVYVEQHESMPAARHHERNIKHWPLRMESAADPQPEPGLGGPLRSAAVKAWVAGKRLATNERHVLAEDDARRA